MEVVINKCYGGFSLSPKALKEYAKRKGLKCYFFDLHATMSNQDKYTPLTLTEAEDKDLFFIAYTVKDPWKYKSKKKWEDMTSNERVEENKAEDKISLSSRKINRHDADLIAVVKKLGKEANGRCADLNIVEIPDGVDYEIDEYDGMEHIAEKHRTWC